MGTFVVTLMRYRFVDTQFNTEIINGHATAHEHLCIRNLNAGVIYVTCSGKRDRWEFFIKIKFLAYIDSSVCAEHNGESFKKKY